MPRSDIPVITPYNPLDKRNLAESVASAMLHTPVPVSYTHLRAHETDSYLVCRLLLEKKKKYNSD